MECSTSSISANNGKVFIFSVKLYRGVFHPIIFSLMVNFSSLRGWEVNWPPTSHVAVLYVCGDWSHCLTHCCILCVGTGHVALRIAVYCVWELVTLPDVLLYTVCGNWSCCLMCCCILCVGTGHIA